MAYIKTIDTNEAEGFLKQLYGTIIESRGKIAEVHKVQSLHPKSIVSHMDLYMTLMFGKSPLTRAQREMIGVIVSAENGCQYCVIHHSASLRKYWQDQQIIEEFKKDYTNIGLSYKDVYICQYALHLTRNPKDEFQEDWITKLKDGGLDDREILDVNLITAYFNFVNRIASGLGVELEEDEGEGYKY